MTKQDDSANGPDFLTLHERIPQVIRDLINEATGCQQNGYLTGGTACAQRAIQALLTVEKIEGPDLPTRMKALSDKHPAVPQTLVTVLQQFGDATARDGAKLSASGLNLLVVTLKAILYEICVLGPERVERLEYVRKVFESIERKAPEKKPEAAPAAAQARAS
jgi:hypothetical protein